MSSARNPFRYACRRSRRCGVSPRISSELSLGLTPHLRERRQAYLKGFLALDIGLSLGYGITALAGIGPPQSDVNTMARGLGIPTWPIGIALVAPALVDIYRYLVPDSRWA